MRIKSLLVGLVVSVASLSFNQEVMADVGVYPVGPPICVGVGACYQKYCHDTGYCWYEQIR